MKLSSHAKFKSSFAFKSQKQRRKKGVLGKGLKTFMFKKIVVALSGVNSGEKIRFAYISLKDILVSNLPWRKILFQAETGVIEKNSLSFTTLYFDGLRSFPQRDNKFHEK